MEQVKSYEPQKSSLDSINNQLNISQEKLAEFQKLKESQKNRLTVNTKIETSDIALDVGESIHSNISQNIISMNENLFASLKNQIIDIPLNDANNFVDKLQDNNRVSEKKIHQIDHQGLEKIGKVIDKLEQDNPSPSNTKNDTTDVFVEAGTGYTQSLIENKNVSETMEYGSPEMGNITNLILDSDGTKQGFMENLKAQNLTEKELFANMSALSLQSLWRIYDTEFSNSSETGDVKYMISEAERVLNQKIDPDQLFGDLKQSMETGESIDSVTCIQYSTIIAQLLEEFGYEVNTGTIETGIQHRFTSVRGNDGNIHIISDGQIFTGKNYKQAYSNYQASEGTISTESNVFDARNKFLGSIQTDTMKHSSDNLSANNSFNIQKLSENISDEGIDDRTRLGVKLTNDHQKIDYTSFNENNNSYNLGIQQKQIGNEGTSILSAEAGLSQLFDFGENTRIKTSQQLSAQEVSFINGNSTRVFGLSTEATGYTGFNIDKYGTVQNDGWYGNISGAAGINILGRGDSERGIPVSDVDINAGVSGKFGFKQEDFNMYAKLGASGELETISNTEATKNLQETAKIGDYFGVGGEFITDDGKFSAEHTRGTYKGLETKTSTVGYETDEFRFTAAHIKEKHNSSIIDQEETTKFSAAYKVGDVSPLGQNINDLVIKASFEENTIGNNVNTKQFGASVSFRF